MQWDTARRFGPEVIDKLLAAEWPEGVLMNVNFPNVAPEGVSGTEPTLQGQRDTSDLVIDERADVRGIAYYWLGFRKTHDVPESDTDFAVIGRGGISVTPLRVNLSDRVTVERLRGVL